MSDLATQLARTPVLPVVTIDNAADATPLAQAMLRGGVGAIEITLRTPAALQAVANIAGEAPEMLLGAGTVLTAHDLQACASAGAKFAVSPGATPALLAAARDAGIPLVPGVATASDIMLAIEHGFDFVKFFPASTSGGVEALKALGAPFHRLRFCPTGGINLSNAPAYLALKNVVCVGGSWVAPADAIQKKDWSRIEALCRAAVQGLRPMSG